MRRLLLVVVMVSESCLRPAVAFARPVIPAVPSALTVLQDIHAHPEAQQSIANQLEALRAQAPGRDLIVGVEGASGWFDFSPYRLFPDTDLTERIGHALLSDNLISGPVLNGLIQPRIRLVGLESPELYISNVEAYRSAAPKQKALQRKISEKIRAIQSEKETVYSSALLAFDQKVERVQNGSLPLSLFIKDINRQTANLYGQLEMFEEAHALETSLDFKKVEQERSRFLSKVLPLLGKSESEFLERWIKEGKNSTGLDVKPWLMLERAGKANGVSMNSYPAFQSYIAYAALSNSIDAEKLLVELEEAKREIYERFSAGASERVKALLHTSHDLSLARKLADFELTAQEWADYNRTPINLEFKAELVDFENFYRFAYARNDAIAQNALKAKADVIVVGGFHTPDLIRLWKKDGVDRISVVRPSIRNIDPSKASSYLTVFAQEKTPLESLFSDWRLFLSPPSRMAIAPLVKIEAPDPDDEFIKQQRQSAAPEFQTQTEAAAKNLIAIKNTRHMMPGPLDGWWRESFFYLSPLTLGLGLANPWLMIAGLLFKLVVFPSWGHSWGRYAPDRSLRGAAYVERLIQRVIWSELFILTHLLLFIGFTALGADINQAAFFSFIAASAAHYLNDWTMNRPDSKLAWFVYDVVRLPRIRMNTYDPAPVRPPLATEMADLKLQVEEKTRGLVREWLADPLNSNRTGAVDDTPDIVTNYLLELSEIEDQEKQQAILFGLQDGFQGMQFQNTQMHLRIARDTSALLYYNFEKFQKTAQIDDLLTTVVGKLYSTIHVDSGMGAQSIYVNATAQAFANSSFKLMKDALEENSDERIENVFLYLEALVAGKPMKPAVVTGVKRALELTKFTPAQLEHRTRKDIVFNEQPNTFQFSQGIGSLAYLDLMTEYLKKNRKELAEIIINNHGESIKTSAYSRFLAILNNKATDVRFEAYLSLIDTVDHKWTSLIRAEMIRAFQAANFTDEQVADIIQKDFIYAFLKWTESNRTDRKWIDFLVGFYGEIERLPEFRLKPDLFEKACLEGTKIGIFNDYKKGLEEWKTSKNAFGVARYKAYLAISHKPEFIQTAREAVRGAILVAELTYEQLLELHTSDFTETIGTYTGPIGSGGVVNFVITLYREVASIEANETNREALSLLMTQATDIAGAFKMELNEWQSSEKKEKSLLSLISLACVFANEIHTEQETAELQTALREVVLSANLTPERLSARVRKDIEFVFGQFVVWQPKNPTHRQLKEDRSISFIMGVYLPLAEKKPEIFPAIFDAMDSVLENKSIDGAIVNFMLNHYIGAVERAYEAQSYQVVIERGLNPIRLMSPSGEIAKQTKRINVVYSEAHMKLGNYGQSVNQGFETSMAAMWNELSSDAYPIEMWRGFVRQMFYLSFMLFRTTSGRDAGGFVTFVDALLNEFPNLKNQIPQDLEMKQRLLAVLMEMRKTRDPARTAELGLWLENHFDDLDTMEEEIGPEKSNWIHAMFLVLSRACRLGTRADFDRAIEFINRNLKDGERPEAYISVVNDARRQFGLGLRAAGNIQAEQELMREAIESYGSDQKLQADDYEYSDLFYWIRYSLFLVWIGRQAEADEMLVQLDAIQDDFLKKFEVSDARLFKDYIAITQAVLVTRDGTSAGLQSGAAYLKKLMINPEGLETLFAYADNGFLVDENFLKAADLVMTEPLKTGIPLEQRLHLVRTLKSMNLEKFNDHVIKWKEFKGGAAFKKMIDDGLTKPQSAWPGDESIADYIAQIKHRAEVDHRAALEGLPKNEDGYRTWFEKVSDSRVGLISEAIALTLRGKTDHILSLISTSRRLWEIGTSYFFRRGAPSFSGESLYFTLMAQTQLIKPVIEHWISLINQKREKTIEVHSGLQAIIKIGSEKWESEKELKKITDQVIPILDKWEVTAEFPSVARAQVEIYRHLGNLEKMRMVIGTLTEVDFADDRANRNKIRTLFNSGVSVMLTDPTLPFETRLEAVRVLLEGTKFFVGKSFFWKLVLELNYLHAESEWSPEEKTLIDFLDLEKLETLPEFGHLLNTGLMMIITEMIILLPPDSEEAKTLESKMEQWSKNWIGRGMEKYSKLSAFSLSLMRDKKPIPESIDPALPLPYAHVVLMGVHMRDQNYEAALKELETIFNLGKPFHNEYAHAQFVASMLSISPISRAAFLSIAKRTLETTPPQAHAAKKKFFKHLLITACLIGDAEILYQFDKLNAYPGFPLKELFSGSQNLIAWMEPALTSDEWVERIARMGTLDQKKIEVLKTRASELLKPEFFAKLDQELDKKIAEFKSREATREAVQKARTHYAKFEFPEAISVLNQIPEPVRTSESSALLVRAEKMAEAWNYHIEAANDPEFDQMAVEVAQNLNGNGSGNSSVKDYDRVPKTFVAYVTGIHDLDAQLKANTISPKQALKKIGSMRTAMADSAIDKLAAVAEKKSTDSESLWFQTVSQWQEHETDLKLIQSDRQGGLRISHSDQMEAMELAWQEILETADRALTLDADNVSLLRFLIKQAESFVNAGISDFHAENGGPATGRFRHAQDLAYLVYANSMRGIDAASEQQLKWRGEALALRAKARPWEVLRDLSGQARMIRTKLAKDLHQVERSIPRSTNPNEPVVTTARQTVLHFGKNDEGGWSYESGRLYIPKVWEAQEAPASTTKKLMMIPTKTWSVTPSNKELPISQAKVVDPTAAYQLSWKLSSGQRLSINATLLDVEEDSSKGEGRGLVLEIDERDAERLLTLKKQLQQGEMRWVEDINSQGQLSVLERVINHLSDDLTRNVKSPSTGYPIMDRMFGLDITPQPLKGQSVTFFNKNLEVDPHQKEMIESVLDPAMSSALVWGPPGSGKTTSLEEICRQLITPRSVSNGISAAGKIVVLVNQSNHGLDNVGEKLKASGMPFVRAAARDKSVSKNLIDEYNARMDLLMQYIERHYNHGAMNGEGFVYLATNNGLPLDRRVFILLKMYLDGVPMEQIRESYQRWSKNPDLAKQNKMRIRPSEADKRNRTHLYPVLMQEEGSLADPAEAMIPIAQLNPKQYVIIGDHKQLDPHGMDSSEIEKVETEIINHDFHPVWKKGRLAKDRKEAAQAFNDIYSDEQLRAVKRSLFERAFTYSQQWGGLPTYMLRVVRRSHWAHIGPFTGFYRWFVAGKELGLISKDQFEHGDDRSKWRPLNNQTYRIVNMDKYGRQFNEEYNANKSRLNFREAGEVIRGITGYLNDGYKPEDIMVLSPYLGQNQLLHELMFMVAVWNDIAAGKEVSKDDVMLAHRFASAHLATHEQKMEQNGRRRVGPVDGTSIRRALRDIELQSKVKNSKRSPALVKELYDLLKPIYGLSFEGPRQIGLDDVKPLPETLGDKPLPAKYADKLDAKTIDAIQGRENKVVILSFVCSNDSGHIGFLKWGSGMKRLNVALSRVQEKILLIGSFDTLIQGSRDKNGYSVYENLLTNVSESYEQSSSNWSILSEVPWSVITSVLLVAVSLLGFGFSDGTVIGSTVSFFWLSRLSKSLQDPANIKALYTAPIQNQEVDTLLGTPPGLRPQTLDLLTPTPTKSTVPIRTRTSRSALKAA